jgi:hypothetical protein
MLVSDGTQSYDDETGAVVVLGGVGVGKVMYNVFESPSLC